jgi:hypothetical protein
MNGRMCRDPALPDRYRTGPGNGYGTQQAHVSCIAGVLKGDHPPCSTNIWSGTPKGIVPEGDT